jgi:hypothetical protein
VDGLKREVFMMFNDGESGAELLQNTGQEVDL